MWAGLWRSVAAAASPSASDHGSAACSPPRAHGLSSKVIGGGGFRSHNQLPGGRGGDDASGSIAGKGARMYPRSGFGPRNWRERSQDERYEGEYANNKDSEEEQHHEKQHDEKTMKRRSTNCHVSAEGRE